MFKPTQFGSSGGGSSGRDRKEGSRGYGGSSSFGGHGGGHRDTYTKMRGSSAGGPSSSRCSSGSGSEEHQKPHVITYRPPSPHPCAPISSNGLQKERVEEIEKESAEGTKRIVEALKERTDDTIRIIGTYQEDEEGIIHGL